MNKKLFAELLGYSVGNDFEDDTVWFLHPSDPMKNIHHRNFKPESDEYYWKILEALSYKQHISLSSKLVVSGTMFSGVAVWYNTHRKEVLEAVEQVLEGHETNT